MNMKQSGAAALPLLALAVGLLAGSGSYGAAAKKAGTGKTAIKKSPTKMTGAALIAQGKKFVQADGCTGCHKLAGKGGTTGPDLTHIGAKDTQPVIVEK